MTQYALAVISNRRRKRKDVPAIHTPAALSARVQGTVVLELRIASDGRVSDARALRSVPELDQAALDAARQWQFTPTIVNGEAVPLILPASVRFALL